MKTYARIENGTVMELLQTSGDITTMFHPSMVWVDCTSNSSVVPGWSYSSGVFSAPAGPSLAQAQATQIATIESGYQNSIIQPIPFTTAGGVTKTFQTDTNSQSVLMQALTGYNLAGSVPSGFFWLAADNTQVPFTLADLKGLAEAMLGQGFVAFSHKATQKAAIRAATTISAVQAIAW